MAHADDDEDDDDDDADADADDDNGAGDIDDGAERQRREEAVSSEKQWSCRVVRVSWPRRRHRESITSLTSSASSSPSFLLKNNTHAHPCYESFVSKRRCDTHATQQDKLTVMGLPRIAQVEPACQEARIISRPVLNI